MTLNRLLTPCYRVIVTTKERRIELSLTDYWPEVFDWCCRQHEGGGKNCCERMTLAYLQEKHVASVSIKTFKKCLTQVGEWFETKGSPYEGFKKELDTLHEMAAGDVRGVVVVQEKDYPNLSYLIPGIETLDVISIPHEFFDER